MKVTVVPAQVTTVEDRIAGSLGLNQLLLLSLPVFGGSTLYFVLPPSMHSSLYKIVAIVALTLVCGLLAIRIKGKILLLWLVVIMRYNLRPRYYVFNKNDAANRNTSEPEPLDEAEDLGSEPVGRSRLARLSPVEIVRLTAILENPAAGLTFKANKKGGLNVLITEIED